MVYTDRHDIALAKARSYSRSAPGAGTEVAGLTVDDTARGARRDTVDGAVLATRRWRSRLARHYENLALRLARPLTRAIDGSLMKHYRQVEALIGLYATLDIELPLPPMRGSPVSPDFARELACVIAETRPETVVEIGSGVSTLVAGYAVKRNGTGRVVSLEHSAEWFAKCARLIDEHDLSKQAMVVHAPLRAVMIDGAQWQWYDTDALGTVASIDLLLVDGPLFDLQAMARYPALPVLGHLLSPEAVIILDDADRPDERAVVARWEREFGPFAIERPLAEKGCVILRKGR
jgi:predicted O-methyltransferase YrrM